MGTHGPGKKRILRSFTLTKLALVDDPAQEGADIVLRKRNLEKAKFAVMTSSDEGHSHLVERIHQAKPLIQRIASQGAAEASIILLEQRSQKGATKRPPAAQLKSLLLPSRRCLGSRRQPTFQGFFHKIPFHAADAQKTVDLFEPLAQGQVIDIAHNGGQTRAQFRGERNHQARHGARL